MQIFRKLVIIMIRIADYARKSVYSDNSDSTQAQYNIGLEYCQSHYEDFEIYRYEDEGFTGANVNRPAFSRLVDDIKDDKLDVVICYKIDRISRNVSDFSSFFNMLAEHNVEFVSIKEQIDTSTPLGRAMMYICSVFAQMERETTAERVKDGMTELAKSGKWAGGRSPLGFCRERVQIGGKSHTVLVENPEELRLLSLVSDMFLSGNYSLSRLETYFRDNHIKTLKGHYFSMTQIYNILRNPIYCTADENAYNYFSSLGCIMAVEREKFDGEHGIMSYCRTAGGKQKKHIINPPNKWIISVGLHKPIWTSEKYIDIQTRFGNNKINKVRKNKVGILRGVVKCSCGWLMGVQHKVDKTYHKTYDNYFCQRRNRQGAEYCNRKFTRVDALDSAAVEILKKIKLDKSVIDDYVFDRQNITLTYRSHSDVQSDIAKTEIKIANLTNSLGEATGSSAAKYIISEIEKLDRALSGFKYELMEISNMEHKQKQVQRDKEEKYNLVCNIVDSLETADYDEINGLIKDLFKECVYDGQNLHIKI